MDRRQFVALTGSALAAWATGLGAMAAPEGFVPLPPYDALARLEEKAGGRLGVAMLTAGSNAVIGYRADERFALCSTFKFSLAAAVLARIDAGALKASAPITIAEKDVITHSPAVKAALPQGAMSVLALAQAAQVDSDNGAANLLLRQIGGPEGLTRFWRSLGDDVSWLDRYEPELNLTQAPDERDTTSPLAMAHVMAAILAGSVLSPVSRDRLLGWMMATRTGLTRLRGGLPQGWRVGDKTGTLADADLPRLRINDIAVVMRPDSPPSFVTAYYEPRDRTPLAEADRALAEVGRIAAQWLGGA